MMSCSIVDKAKQEKFFEDEVTPSEEFPVKNFPYIKDPINQTLFELSREDVEIVEGFAEKEKIPYHLAVQNVLRDALNLYHKFIRIGKK
jgi:hypothetical protein